MTPAASVKRAAAPGPLLIAVHSAAAGGAQAMALAEAECFAERCPIVAAVPEGPMRERFAACAEVVDVLQEDRPVLLPGHRLRPPCTAGVPSREPA